MISSDLDYLDYARIAKQMRGMSCYICGCSWECPYDVTKRKPFLVDGEVTACEQCYTTPGNRSTELVKFCMGRSEELTPAEEVLVTRVASLGNLDMDDFRRLMRIAARLRGEHAEL